MEEPRHHQKLWDNTNYFRREVQGLGFDTGVSTTDLSAIYASGESGNFKSMTKSLEKHGVMAGAVVSMVARDKARIRTQMSSGLSMDDLNEVLSIFEKVGPEVGLV